MVMADRPEVQTATPAVAALTMVGLGQNLLTGLARIPFVQPWRGPGNIVANLGQSVTRQTIRSFMGYSLGLPIEEFRSMEQVIDGLCRVVMPPFVKQLDGVPLTKEEIGGVPGRLCRRQPGPPPPGGASAFGPPTRPGGGTLHHVRGSAVPTRLPGRRSSACPSPEEASQRVQEPWRRRERAQGARACLGAP